MQSIETIEAYVEQSRLLSTMTDNISAIWFSEEITDGRVDVHEACARYGMTDAEILAFSRQYTDYAFVGIPLRIENTSQVEIGGFHVALAKESEERPLWLYTGNVGGFYTTAESGASKRQTVSALVNQAVCPLDKVDEWVRRCGLKLTFTYTLTNGQSGQKTIDVRTD